ncbi:hypothetical protein [Pseudoalteromonas sp. ESRF-bin5]|uniref:hypothetical protein n=1 Tax=Pseudoalteromonas sp. ESRF-bin5 TaxID=2014532 RepID=UPI00257E619A|nr:hypothetical protein [Pseudoalteromonas sp. ESRF-bin5]
MRNFIIIFFIVILGGCSIYPGSYFHPESSIGDVLSTGSCGDNTPSKLMINSEQVELTTQARTVQNNGDKTWIWFEAKSKIPFVISASPKDIIFISNGKIIEPHEIYYSYKKQDSIWLSHDYKTLKDLPKSSGVTNNLLIVFRLKHYENIQFQINKLIVSGQPVKNFNIEFKNTKKIRVSALNC